MSPHRALMRRIGHHELKIPPKFIHVCRWRQNTYGTDYKQRIKDDVLTRERRHVTGRRGLAANTAEWCVAKTN